MASNVIRYYYIGMQQLVLMFHFLSQQLLGICRTQIRQETPSYSLQSLPNRDSAFISCQSHCWCLNATELSKVVIAKIFSGGRGGRGIICQDTLFIPLHRVPIRPTYPFSHGWLDTSSEVCHQVLTNKMRCFLSNMWERQYCLKFSS